MLTPVELVERMASFVVRPPVHFVCCHGVFAPNAAWRPRIVDGGALAARRCRARSAHQHGGG